MLGKGLPVDLHLGQALEGPRLILAQSSTT